MTTTGINISMFVGETKHIVGTALGKSGAFNLSSAVIKWVVQRTLDDNAPVIIYKDTADGITITNQDAGQFVIGLDPNDTRNLSAGTYYHMASVIDSDEETSIMFSGLLTLQKSSKNI